MNKHSYFFLCVLVSLVTGLTATCVCVADQHLSELFPIACLLGAFVSLLTVPWGTNDDFCDGERIGPYHVPKVLKDDTFYHLSSAEFIVFGVAGQMLLTLLIPTLWLSFTIGGITAGITKSLIFVGLVGIAAFLNFRRKAQVEAQEPKIHETAQIHETAVLHRPSCDIGAHALIGAGVSICKGGTVDEYAQIGEHTHIKGGTVGAGTVIGTHGQIREWTRIGANSLLGNHFEISEFAEIESDADIGNNVKVGGSSRIGKNVRIGSGTVIKRAVIGANVVIGPNVRMGYDVIVRDGVEIPANTIIQDNAVIEESLPTVTADRTQFRVAQSDLLSDPKLQLVLAPRSPW